MTRHFCDLCGEPTANPDMFRDVKIKKESFGVKIYRPSGSQVKAQDLCAQCSSTILQTVITRLEGGKPESGVTLEKVGIRH